MLLKVQAPNRDRAVSQGGGGGGGGNKNNNKQQKGSPWGSGVCSRLHRFTFATVRRTEGGWRGEEKEVTSTWTIACLCLLKAHKSPPSGASSWCCRPPACRTAPAFGCPPEARQVKSADRRASAGPGAAGVRVYGGSTPYRWVWHRKHWAMTLHDQNLKTSTEHARICI